MRFISVLFAIILTSVVIGTGCESLGIHIDNPTTQPTSNADRVAAAQHDLNTTWAAAKLANALGAFSPAQWKVITTQLNTAQAAIDLAVVAVDTQPKDLEQILNAATDAVVAFKARAEPKS